MTVGGPPPWSDSGELPRLGPLGPSGRTHGQFLVRGRAPADLIRAAEAFAGGTKLQVERRGAAALRLTRGKPGAVRIVIDMTGADAPGGAWATIVGHTEVKGWGEFDADTSQFVGRPHRTKLWKLLVKLAGALGAEDPEGTYKHN